MNNISFEGDKPWRLTLSLALEYLSNIVGTSLDFFKPSRRDIPRLLYLISRDGCEYLNRVYLGETQNCTIYPSKDSRNPSTIVNSAFLFITYIGPV